MRPAASLLLFTVLSGAGFGLLALAGLALAPVRGWAGAAVFASGFGLAGAGLIASSHHLGRPDRAVKAFREWRSSWLSREAWLAVATMTVMGLYAFARFAGLEARLLGALGAALAAATVIATAMIYAQLRTVPRWHHWSVPVLFVAYAATAGTLLAGWEGPGAILLAVTGIGQALAWRAGDARVAAAPESTGSATGLAPVGRVRPFEAPHTGESYLTREMVFVVARKHARRLRLAALGTGFALPLLLCLLPLAPLAGAVHLAGAFIARWLFYAEAEHVLRHYYR